MVSTKHGWCYLSLSIFYVYRLAGWFLPLVDIFHDQFIVNIVLGFEAIIWYFLLKNAHDCNITIMMHDITILLS